VVRDNSLIYLNGKMVLRELLASELQSVLKEHPQQKIYFYADKMLNYEQVCLVLNEIQSSGAKGVVLRTQR